MGTLDPQKLNTLNIFTNAIVYLLSNSINSVTSYMGNPLSTCKNIYVTNTGDLFAR